MGTPAAPVGAAGTAVGVVQLTILGPGLIRRGLQQLDESLDEDLGDASFRNLRGLLPRGQDLDDPGETFGGAAGKAFNQGRDAARTLSRDPVEGAKKALKFLQDTFAF